MEIQALPKEKVVICSKFDFAKYSDSVEAQIGWYHLNKEGQYIKHRKVRDNAVAYRHTSSSPDCDRYVGYNQSNPPWVNDPNITRHRHIIRDENGREVPSVRREVWPYSVCGD